MAEEILAISAGIKKLRSTRLNDKALFLLIQRASSFTNGRKIGIPDIESVFQGIEDLEKTFIRK